MSVRTSIIIPLFKGEKYIPDIICQIEKCFSLTSDMDMELVLSNDDPAHAISDIAESDTINISILNTDANRGIHAARIRGFLHSTGDYILFLDQDDKIKPEYFISQLKALGSADAVVCNALICNESLNERRLKYNADRPLGKTVSRACMINEGNMILSPGQVLMRRNAVPKSWLHNRMQYNGADDWLLWLCMHDEGKKFALNSEVLFLREVHYHNASFDNGEMEKSEQEAVRIIEEQQLLKPDERKKLRLLLSRLQAKRNKENAKWRKMFLILNDWFRISSKGDSIADYLQGKGIKEVAVYGYGYLGRTLVENLEQGHINVAYVIDKNAAFLNSDKDCYTLESELKQVDAVIITLVSDDKEIEDQLRNKLKGNIYRLEDVISGILKYSKG